MQELADSWSPTALRFAPPPTPTYEAAYLSPLAIRPVAFVQSPPATTRRLPTTKPEKNETKNPQLN